MGVGAAQAQQTSDATQAAREAAGEWIESMNEQEFEDSWEEAAPSFRERGDREQWVRRGRHLADSLGTPSSRTLMAVQVRDSLRQTSGPFVVFTYRATFADTVFEETLVLTQHEDDWRVAGYQFAPPRSAAAPSRPGDTR